MRLKIPNAVTVFCLIVVLMPLAATLSAQTMSQSQAASMAVPSPDPNKGPSEFNHHIAGWALVGVGILVLASQLSPRLRGLRYLLPFLFIGVGLFLAVWSDGEIWPRGNLNWAWLIHHDAEARQHKIYALLLICIGAIEYCRMRGWLSKSWRTWAFPVLAVLGAAMLLVHDHTAGSGANLPEAQAYLVNPMLNVDGTARRAAANPESATMSMDHAAGEPMDHASMHDPSMSMDHSGGMTEATANQPSHSQHHHEMSASMMMVEREHFWFMIVGIGIALFKFISDGKLFRSRLIGYMWPTFMIVLGCALVVYRE